MILLSYMKIDSEKLKNGKTLFFLVALLCTSMLNHAACNCGFYWMNVGEFEGEGEASSIQSNAASMLVDQEWNSGSRFELLSICTAVNHVIGYNDGICMLSQLEPGEVTSDYLFIESWRTEVIDSIEVIFLTVRFRTHHCLMQLILNMDECCFPTEACFSLGFFSNLEELNLELQDVPGEFWLWFKQTCLAVFIVIILVFCIVLRQFAASNLNPSSSSGANDLSRPVEESKAVKIESLSKSPETPLSGKQNCRRNRRKRRISSSSSQVVSPIMVAADLAFGTILMEHKSVEKDKKPIEDDDSNFLFRSSNDHSMKIPTSTLPLHARAPGPKHEKLKKITDIINEQYQYDIWADHLLEIALSELWNSFFVIEPEFIVNSQI